MNIVSFHELTKEHIEQADFIFAVYQGVRLNFLYEPSKKAVKDIAVFSKSNNIPKTLEVVVYDSSEDVLVALREKIRLLNIE
ncbi:hypothetical protein [Tolumonas lignilytica]|uniref:hypothetical protein n=1 Tax=Tolumonas lignilytica TaxID=1283284 RepID=UPI0004635674|nr:hypothetical protein [Tolumonas lignilytica]